MTIAEPAPLRTLKIEVVEAGARAARGWTRCEIGSHIRFDTEGLESYFFASWQPVVFDLMLIAAAVEYCDRRLHRPALGWARRFELRIPVHEPDRWSAPAVSDALHDALNFLTGDVWSINFTRRRATQPEVRQGLLQMSSQAEAVIAFSNGLDSRSVAGLTARDLGPGLVRIRVGSERRDKLALRKAPAPFASIPYKVRGIEVRLSESSARSRGFKFAVITMVAAFLADLSRIIVPESGQGALGPALVPVGHAYEDYRNHPLFTARMERLALALFTKPIAYEFPRLWHTKGETLAAFLDAYPGETVWAQTWSCWQDSRQAFVGGKKRQCGICAACMLRRMSIDAAGLSEDPSRYVWENLSVSSFEDGAATDYPMARRRGAMAQYALAGTLHLQHLSELNAVGPKRRSLDRAARQIGRALGLSGDIVEQRVQRMISRHGEEWSAFQAKIGEQSFVSQWARNA
jgi:7-cyano-7-deazaguanine synthase in queuosine biosynthesis